MKWGYEKGREAGCRVYPPLTSAGLVAARSRHRDERARAVSRLQAACAGLVCTSAV